MLKLGWNLRGKFEKFFVLDYTSYLDYGPGSSAQKSKYGYAYDQFMKEAQKIKTRFFLKKARVGTLRVGTAFLIEFLISQTVRDETDRVGTNHHFSSQPVLPHSKIFREYSWKLKWKYFKYQTTKIFHKNFKN